jgi:hypothetical protein
MLKLLCCWNRTTTRSLIEDVSENFSDNDGANLRRASSTIGLTYRETAAITRTSAS